MPFELLHFRESEEILNKKKMTEDVMKTLEYLDTVLFEAPNKGELLKQALKDMGWREDGTLNIMEGRRYQHRGFKNRIAIEGYIGTFENLEGYSGCRWHLIQKIDTGILLMNSLRSFDSPFGSSRELAEWEIDSLSPQSLCRSVWHCLTLGKSNLSPL